MIMTSLLVALGGAIGAVARFWVGMAALRFAGAGFPVGVISVNIAGSFLMGIAIVYLGPRGAGQLHPFIMTGILGGFTTFSAFSLEAFTLFERGDVALAALYVVASVVASIAALIFGIYIMRGALA